MSARTIAETQGNDLDAMLSIASDCLSEQDYAAAAHWVEQALEVDAADAYGLWLKYQLISLAAIEVSQKERYDILLQSARNGNSSAMIELASLYNSGKSKGGHIKMNKVQAAAWYKVADACGESLNLDLQGLFDGLSTKQLQQAENFYSEYISKM